MTQRWRVSRETGKERVINGWELMGVKGKGGWGVGKWENNRGKKKMETKERPESGNAISKNENKKKRMK